MSDKTKKILKLVAWSAASAANLYLAWFLGGKVGESIVEVSMAE